MCIVFANGEKKIGGFGGVKNLNSGHFFINEHEIYDASCKIFNKFGQIGRKKKIIEIS